jgi:predicted phage terminase large subunit-like protein
MATIEVKAQEGPQKQFLESPSDIVIFGGAAGGGKSHGLLLEALRHFRVPGFNGIIFRRTFPQIAAPGAIWDQSVKLCPLYGGQMRLSEMLWTFPSGAKLKFGHLQHENDVLNWQGSELTLIGFDELTQFDESQFWYLLSRNRSTCGIRPYIRATCNPDADSFVAKLLEWWIDQNTGLPIQERSGKLRWFVRVNDQLVWADTREELLDKHAEVPPKSLTFIPAKLSDNAILMAKDPGYLANLLALPLVERERLLGGNWKIRPMAGLIFNRTWFDIVQAAPVGGRSVSAWDKAGTQDGGNWSCRVRMKRADSGLYYVEHVIRGQWSSLDRNSMMRQMAVMDGSGEEIVLEQEPGSGGKESAEISVRELAGFNVHAGTVTGTKEARARGFSAQAEARNVKLVAGPWNEDYLAELHAFPNGAFDDAVDASSSAFNRLALHRSFIPEAELQASKKAIKSPFPANFFSEENKRNAERMRQNGN